MNRTLEVTWTIIKLIATLLWLIIRVCLGLIIAITIGSIKGAGRVKQPSSGSSRD